MLWGCESVFTPNPFTNNPKSPPNDICDAGELSLHLNRDQSAYNRSPYLPSPTSLTPTPKLNLPRIFQYTMMTVSQNQVHCQTLTKPTYTSGSRATYLLRKWRQLQKKALQRWPVLRGVICWKRKHCKSVISNKNGNNKPGKREHHPILPNKGQLMPSY